MENKFDNYDMFDKLIANNKKAQSWTIFWVTALCILAGAVLWMAVDISKKKKQLFDKDQTIQSQEEFLIAKNQLIDSLVANCNVAKKEIVKTYDSAIVQTQNALKAIVNTNIEAGMPVEIAEMQQNEIKKVNKGFQTVKTNLENIKLNIEKTPTRIFIQYNNKDNSGQVEQLLSNFKANKKYYVAPPEYVDNSFTTVIKFYNFKNEDEEKELKELVARQFKMDANNIRVTYENNPKIKSTIEIWIGTRARVRNISVQQQMIKEQN